MSKTKIALIQMKMSSDPKKNRDDALSKIKLAVNNGAKIVCLPELFLTKYFCQSEEHKNFNYAEGIPGPSTDFFSIISKKFKIILIVPLFEKKNKGPLP